MKVKITILGNVHNVGYRPFLLDLADSLFIDKFDARNVTVNGKQAVIVLVESDERTVKQFIELVKEEKPENAVVEDVKVEEFEGLVRPIESYRQSLVVNQLNKIVQVGLQMLDKQDKMLDKQDLMLDKMDVMLEKQDKMLEKQDETIKIIREESEKTREVIKDEGEKTRNILGEKIDNVSEKIDRLDENVSRTGKEVTQEIRDLRTDIRSYLDKRLKKIESEIKAIKSKLKMT